MWLFRAPYLEYYLLDASYALVITNVFVHAQESLEKSKSKVFMALKWHWKKPLLVNSIQLKNKKHIKLLYIISK